MDLFGKRHLESVNFQPPSPPLRGRGSRGGRSARGLKSRGPGRPRGSRGGRGRKSRRTESPPVLETTHFCRENVSCFN